MIIFFVSLLWSFSDFFALLHVVPKNMRALALAQMLHKCIFESGSYCTHFLTD
jgi:hypothetical protein